MELLPVVVVVGGVVAMWVLIASTNGRGYRENAQVLETWAARRGHHFDGTEHRVTGRAGGRVFTVGRQRRYELGDARMAPIMTFPGPFALPESEFRHRLPLGFTRVGHRLGGVRPLRLDTPEFRARTHELVGTDVRFLADAWALRLGDILAGAAVPLSYWLTPDGTLEVEHVAGLTSTWTEQALDEAVATGGRLAELFESMDGRPRSR